MVHAHENLVLEANKILPELLQLLDDFQSPVVLIDGRAGSGKSTVAEILKNLVFQELQQSPRVLHMDDLYPGWEGLELGSIYLHERILKPLRATGKASWQRWDWAKSARGGADAGNGWRFFDGGNLLIVEGCGSVTEANKSLSNLTIWVDAEHEQRRSRFIRRDGGKFADHWSTWTAQEDAFYLAHSSRGLCDRAIQN